jgi:hypothetical protein
MNQHHSIIAFLATLVAIVALVITGAMLAINGRSSEALGIGGAVTGLIGVIGTFRPRTQPDDNATGKANDLVNIEVQP